MTEQELWDAIGDLKQDMRKIRYLLYLAIMLGLVRVPLEVIGVAL